jgi:hypothetical protein
MKRRLFNIATALSLLLCVALAALWVRSLRHFELVQVRYAHWPQADELHSCSLGFSWYSNTLRLQLIRVPFAPAHFRGRSDDRLRDFRVTHPPGLRWNFVGENVTRFMNGYAPGFAAGHYPYTMGPAARGDRSVLAVRPWLPALLTAVLPAAWLIRFRQARRALRRGLCPTCGYDLRASPERCPECGAASAEPAAA